MAQAAVEQTNIADIADGARNVIKEATLGPGMKKLQLQRQSAYLDLKNSGRLKPCTIINFNPVSLKVDDGHVPWRVPAGTDSDKSLKVKFGGREYRAAIFTVREPKFVPWIRDVRPPADEGENPASEYDAKFILPLELLDQYRISYCDPVGRIGMGGMLCFEGDVHAFTKNQEKTIRVPRFTTLPDRTRSYYSEEVSTGEALKETLEMQKVYCTQRIQEADEYNQDEMQRKNITPVHRIWAKFALAMGWKQVAPPWMSATLESEDVCVGCGKGRTRSDAWFCACGRPYNAFAAFMAGENVPESYLFALKGEEQANAMKELDRRQKIREKFTTK